MKNSDTNEWYPGSLINQDGAKETMTNARIPDQAELHDELENIGSNKTDNRPFADILSANLSRRSVMRGSLAGAATGFLAPTAMAQAANGSGDLVNFRPVTLEQATADPSTISISPDYEYQVLASWGTPIEPRATKSYDGQPDTRPTSEEAALQIGIGHDGMWYFPMRTYRGRQIGMMVLNHEFGSNAHVLGKPAPESLEDVRLSQHVHGVSVFKIAEDDNNVWHVRREANARRIHVNTPVTFSGPAAGSAQLENINGNIPLGTLNNCGSGPTPWNTYLTCEENFNGYFGYTDPFYTPTEAQERYGFSDVGFGYGWHLFDKRFDISDPEYANEHKRFGWIVEIDPFDGTQTPVKRTALGRFKHEAIAIAVAKDGRIAGYMGDDERFDYCYRYVSNKPWKEAIKAGESPLDDGILYVAKFNDDGTGEWLPLTMDNPALASRFEDMADLLINTRIAADLVGATPMDRPEWATVGKDGEVYWALTNNSRREVSDAANPEAPNTYGHIIRTTDADDFTGSTFTWDIYIIASSTQGTELAFGSPDAAYADPFGRLFIGTDGGQNAPASGFSEEEQARQVGLQDQLIVFDTTKPEAKPVRLLTGVTSDEVTGFTHTPDYETAFVNIQHPGNGDPTRTSFPAPNGSGLIPRDSVLVIKRKGGGVVGS